MRGEPHTHIVHSFSQLLYCVNYWRCLNNPLKVLSILTWEWKMRRRSFTEKSSEMKKMPAAWGDVRTSKVYLTSKCPDSFTRNWHPSWEPLCVLWSSLFVHVHEVWPTLYMGSALNILHFISFGQVDNLLFTVLGSFHGSLSLDRTPKGTRRGLIRAESCWYTSIVMYTFCIYALKQFSPGFVVRSCLCLEASSHNSNETLQHGTV